MNRREPVRASLQHLVFFPQETREKYPTVVALHGRGSDYSDLPPVIQALGVDGLLVVAPRAPLPFVSGGYAWYELKEEGLPSPETFSSSLRLLRRFLGEIANAYPIDGSRLLLLGFSQGTVMAYAAGLQDHRAVRGIVALSGYIPTKSGLPLELKNLSDLSVFISHGTYDNLIPVHYGREAATLLRNAGAEVLYKEYPMGHQLTGETISDLSGWMKPLVT